MLINVGSIVDLIIALVVIEMATLGIYRKITHRGMPLAELLSFMGAGLGLLVACRVLLGHGSFISLSAALLASLVLQVWHVKQRWK